MRLNKYSESDLRKAVSESKSISGSLKKLNIVPCGGNYETFKRAIIFFEIDTSHFLGQGWNKGNTPSPPKNIEEYLNNNLTITSFKLKNRLLKERIKTHECEKCKRRTWLNMPIPLELHHINGNNKDNSLNNLIMLCPNCHSLTDGFRNRK